MNSYSLIVVGSGPGGVASARSYLSAGGAGPVLLLTADDELATTNVVEPLSPSTRGLTQSPRRTDPLCPPAPSDPRRSNEPTT